MTTPTADCLSGTIVSFCPGPGSSAPSLTGSVVAGALIFGFSFFMFIGALFWYRYRRSHRSPLQFFGLEAARWVLHSQPLAGSHSWRKRVRDSFLWSQLFGIWRPPSRTGGPRQTARRAHYGGDAPAVGLRRPQRVHLRAAAAPPPPYDPYDYDPVLNVFVMHEIPLGDLTPDARSPEGSSYTSSGAV